MSCAVGGNREVDPARAGVKRTGGVNRAAERGAALVIALLLLVILTLLATTGMRTAVAELWMAGSEQFHRNAAEAASAGVEAAVARLSAGDSDAATFDGAVADAPYSVTIRRAGTEASLPGSSAEKFVGEHFEIESTGAAARGAREVQIQGVMVITSAAGVRTFQQRESGLGKEAGS